MSSYRLIVYITAGLHAVCHYRPTIEEFNVESDNRLKLVAESDFG